LALNPDGFISETDKQVCQTLVHEMTHVFQHVHGKPSARGYHNKEWAAKMKSIGLQPSSTGPGCGQNAWGKPDLAIACIPCRTQMVCEMQASVQSYDQKAA
jgi:predicted SprT family Zn-dependent metalloprotease